MKSYLLDVVAVYFNPLRWKSRQALFQEFIKHMVDSGVRLTVVECAFGDRSFEIKPRRGVNHRSCANEIGGLGQGIPDQHWNFQTSPRLAVRLLGGRRLEVSAPRVG